MRLLFVHQNFPGQYRHLAPYLAGKGHHVAAIGDRENLLPQRHLMSRIQVLGYGLPRSETAPEPFEASLLAAIHRGRAVAGAAASLRKSGFRPDVMFAHIGWGEALFLKDVFPEAKLVLYCEFFYRAR